ncbi:MAG TPA: hypothetical protein VK498_06935 [Ferruginibacter sp.]|nr:hypothetical protein [Ferruginibacter sp.]
MKKIILSAVLLILCSTAFCQSFMHGAGIIVMGGTNGKGSNNDFSIGEGFTYSPRFNFIESESMSVSVGIPLSIGVSASTSTSYDTYYGYSDNSSVGIIANIPLIVNLNFGRGSTKENRDKMGYFAGAGFGYHHGDFIGDFYDGNNNYTDSYSTNTFGPAANAGIRIGVGRKHRNIEIRLSYMKGLNENKPNTFGLACLFNF